MKNSINRTFGFKLTTNDLLKKIRTYHNMPCIFIDIDAIIFNQKKLNHFFLDKLKYTFERLSQHHIQVVLLTDHTIDKIEEIFNNISMIIASTQRMQIKLNRQKIIFNDIDPAKIKMLINELENRCKYYPDVKIRADHKCICIKYKPASNFQNDISKIVLSIRDQFPEFKNAHHQDRLIFIPYQADKDFAIETVLKNLDGHHLFPIYIGHDLNDFSGFSTVQKNQGIGIKLGYGKTNAEYRITDIFELFDLFEGLIPSASGPFLGLDCAHVAHPDAAKPVSI